MKLLDSLLDAIVRLEGDALVMHVGEKPYVVTTSASMSAYRGPLAWGQVELSSRVLTVDAVQSMLGQILPADQRQALDEFGAIEHEIAAPQGIPDRFTVVAARGGDDIWLELRRTPIEVPQPQIAAPEPVLAEQRAMVGEPGASAESSSSGVGVQAPPPHPPEASADIAAPPAAGRDVEPGAGGRVDDADQETIEVESVAEVTEIEERVAVLDEVSQHQPEHIEHMVISVGGPGSDTHEHVALDSVPGDAIEVVDDEAQGVPSDEEVDAMLAATASALLASDIPTADEAAQPMLSLDSMQLVEDEAAIEQRDEAEADAVVPPGAEPEEAIVPEPHAEAAAHAQVEEEHAPAVAEKPEPIEETVHEIASDAIDPQAPLVMLVMEEADEPTAPAMAVEPEPPGVEPVVVEHPVEVEELPAAAAVIEHEPAPAAIVEFEPAAVAPVVAAREQPEPTPNVEEAPAAEVPIAAEDHRAPAEDLPLAAGLEIAAVAPPYVREPEFVVPETAAAASAVPPAQHETSRIPVSETLPGLHGDHGALSPGSYTEPHHAPSGDVRPGVVVPLAGRARSEGSTGGATLVNALRAAAARNASTVYLVAQSKPVIRANGEIIVLEQESALTAADIERLVTDLAPQRRTGGQDEQLEWMSDVPEVGRVRCLTFRDHRGPGVIFRMDQVALSSDVKSLCAQPDGLVLVAGPHASGKSTLLNAVVDQINVSRGDHVITLESQVGFVHESRRSFISQREVGGDAAQAAAAARAALREDPDVLVIEDLQSPDMIAVALEAAETGRLVFASVSAPSTAAAIEQLLAAFPAERRGRAARSMAGALRGVVSQVLVRRAHGGRTPAREVMLNTPAVAGMIREGRTDQLPGALESGRGHGMVAMTDSLAALVRDGSVQAAEAYRKATDRMTLLARFKQEGVDTSFADRLV